MSTQENVRIGGFAIRKTTSADLAAYLLMRRQQGEQVALFFANTNFIVQCRDLHVRMAQEGIVIVNDGVGMDIAANLMQGEHFEENLNGTDFVPFLFRQSATPLRVFMIGGKPGVLRQAALYATRQLGQIVVGMCDGYRCVKTKQNLLETINRAQADILLVALGNPIQEKWILDYRRHLNVPILAGVGALFDFWGGDKPRAPILVQKMRMEWFFRLCLEPNRLAQRYTVDIAKFLKYCYQYRLDDRPRG
ncbi:MAG: polysaccharide biosynthesis protein GumM [Thiobacillus sp. SCN 63-57]|uniref:WecB/TagA/CpsF family glycosyltransferase n=1 Tax=Thiobacillus sp. SCN 63-57 TaxID=1660145 RepID=UPI00086ADAEA|nr:WecB/TagA/CpsF family glycosyltransferase [Thiobacillus sp. SCN 63-57]ODU99357.1 MAG: polysaccharide biosynthesis protein GumM [Thiobacillus sp. SCN 63-57]